jgi:hypothetical protein
MIVVGAGASHDSVVVDGTEAYRPPLTGTLFSNRINLERYLTGRGAAKGLVAEITSQLERERLANAGLSVEEALTREYEVTRENPFLHRGFTALRFYLRDLFRDVTKEWPKQVGGATHYTWLVRNVEKWRSDANGYVLWVTFNYDGLLDQALQDLYDWSFEQGGQADKALRNFIEYPDWALIKLHGSYDWRRQTTLKLGENLGTGDANATYAALERYWDAARDSPVDRTIYERAPNGSWQSDADLDRSLWVPALMAPLAAKSTFECPPVHRRYLATILPQVDLIYTIGWRAQEAHFLNELSVMRRNPPDVLALTRGASTAAVVAERVRSASGQTDPEGTAQRAQGDPREGFSDLRAKASDFPTELGELFLEARQRRLEVAGRV